MRACAIATTAAAGLALAACTAPGIFPAEADDDAAPRPTGSITPAAFPVVDAWADGDAVRQVLHEVSMPAAAGVVKDATGFEPAVVEGLGDASARAVATRYVFYGGVEGPNPFGAQRDVLESAPGARGYSPLWREVSVRWVDDADPRELRSEAAIRAAERRGELSLRRTAAVINAPVLPDGENAFPVVTGFVDGETVDYLLEEISDPAITDLLREDTGFPLVTVPALESVGRVANLYLFRNGVQGPNPFGFQRNVIDSAPGDAAYSPMWLHTFVRWTDDATPRELRSEEEIFAAKTAGEVTLERTALVINCPVIPGTVR